MLKMSKKHSDMPYFTV